MLFYELREADDELGLGITLAHEEHFSPAEFLEAVEAARTRVASAYEEETLIEAIAAELERTHGFTAALDRAIAAAVIVTGEESSSELVAGGHEEDEELGEDDPDLLDAEDLLAGRTPRRTRTAIVDLDGGDEPEH
ncbi:MAG: hypothetical protein DWI49_01165 [Chloroflexi bacterium]|jgi:hypothetical protein|nr:MAG: hypothetical protein DWI46_00805 [Chloroflexota bacterium]RLT28626.1 MAG: hypothetical protein DWI49_01165 [Chloroflexota bacterium]